MLLGKKENVILKLEIRSSSQRKKKKKNAKAYAEYTRSEASNPYIIYILFRLIVRFRDVNLKHKNIMTKS